MKFMLRSMWVLVALAWASGVSLCGAVELSRGTLDGAHFTIARNEAIDWNRRVLLIAHGFRPKTAPLVADLFPDQQAYATLLEEGWLIAKTSYRRNGIIIEDAIADLDNLRAHIDGEFGRPGRVIIEGDSMGGTIATHLMERDDDRYAGAVAIGAALDLRETGGAAGVTMRPLRPLLFMSNRSEISGPLAYAANAQTPPDRSDLRPPVFRIERDGHVNVNQAERLTAIRALNRWLDRGRSSLPPAQPFDATVQPTPRPSQVDLNRDRRGLVAEVIHISAIYGNVWINLQPSDLDQIGLKSGMWFQLEINGQTYRARYGKGFDSVERGQWVIFPNADGFFWVSRNWGNAAETADIALGDDVQIRRFPSSD